MESGTKLGHYEILSLLGKGGMGEVWRARDTKLGREVAIKTLPEEFAKDADRLARFEREAKLLASLNHPNIAAIYGLEEDGDRSYLVLEMVEGETLAERLDRSGPFPVDEVLGIGRQVAQALESAHARGITHRDIKPANIKITPEGRIKVLDFGLAKNVLSGQEIDLSQIETLTVATEAGQILGTPAYMSPERARGETFDGRTDVWAFGCVLYELLSGRQPFAGKTVPETFAAILEREPDWEVLPPSTPDRFQDLLRQCLVKDPERRLPSISEADGEIDRIAAGQPAIRSEARLASRPSIAVLPLANASGDPDQEYFSEGMIESLLTELAKIRALKVISRTSAARYRNSDKAIPQIARELGVGALIEGSAGRLGDRLRLSVQLIDARTEEIIWGDTYIRDLADVLIVQGEVTQAIAEQIHVQLSPEEQDQLASARRVDPEAYEAYQRGQFHWSRLTPPELDLALEYFERARRKEPALGYAGIAAVWVARQQMGFCAPSEAGPRVREATLRAVEANDRLPEVQYILALSRFTVERDWYGAIEAMEHALSLRPNFPQARAHHSHHLMVVNRTQEAVRQMELALELDPQNEQFRSFYGAVLFYVRQYEKAIAEFQVAQRTGIGNPVIRQGLSWTFHVMGRFAEALATQRAGYAKLGDNEVMAALDRGTDYADSLCQAADLLSSRARTRFYGRGCQEKHVPAERTTVPNTVVAASPCLR